MKDALVPPETEYASRKSRSFAVPSRFRWYKYRAAQILRSIFYTVIYSLRNRISVQRVTGIDGPVVSITSHGTRVDTVHLTIEAIGAGNRKPRRLLLFLDNPKIIANLPRPLARLQTRGLEILLAKNFGPHTKYYPFLLSQTELPHPLVTADDDMFYPASWLEDLYSAHVRDPSVIWCNRVRVIQLSDMGMTSLYTWPFSSSNRPDPFNFTEGVSGVIYPQKFLRCLQQWGDKFLGCCPKQDDAWINAVAIKMGFKRAQVAEEAMSYPEILGTVASGLWNRNYGSFGDVQIAEAFAYMGISVFTPAGVWQCRNDTQAIELG